MSVLLTYDIPNNHVTVKSAMIVKGYMKVWTSGGQTYNLPNTTVWRTEGTADQAIEDIRSVTAYHGVSLERAVAVTFEGNWSAIPGIPFK